MLRGFFDCFHLHLYFSHFAYVDYRELKQRRNFERLTSTGSVFLLDRERSTFLRQSHGGEGNSKIKHAN